MSVPYWRLSGFYFCYFATLGGFLPYWSLYLESVDFNAIEIGELSALLVGTKIIAPNIWGWIADRSGRSLRIIRIACFFAVILFSGFLFVEGYFAFALLTVAFSFFWNAALPQFEAATLFHLKQEPQRYSQIRLWGSIGFIVTVTGIGGLLDWQGLAFMPEIITGLLGSIWLMALLTPEAYASQQGIDGIAIGGILKKPEVWAFFFVYMLLQVAHGPYYVFYSIFLNQHDYSGTTTGMLWSLGVFAEIVLFVLMRRVLVKYSLRHILLVSILLSIVRWLLIGWCADNLALLVFAQVLHAATFGATHVTAIHLVDYYFGHRHQGKGQALYSSVSFGLGGVLGSLYSGYFWDSQGARFVYSIAAVCCCLALLIAYVWVGRDNAKQAGFV
ncbi:MFS transporter [Methylotuvimicrobium alcaliphilum]|uniref:Major facilitator superfamily MFS_1 n=1 Tax=Methylotuvimicrobium alcaliphilum (strain DSM 19304 / NCIMB 14124 / VKM B-2133 / 20Z) TaxID=1091494 RepID=G4SZA4_META2|nr:MFS transporter [Methylotuvimicrobium alcaliphilum]CCE23241.1 Major facilitator superfamily MFS_1 [Methylotuvimicrobium alcaliphilum 20Z]